MFSYIVVNSSAPMKAQTRRITWGRSVPVAKKYTAPNLTLAEIFVLRSFIKFNKAPTKCNEALTKP